MSAADAAWEEWADDIPGDPEDYADVKGIWMAGYRRALLDAADGIVRNCGISSDGGAVDEQYKQAFTDGRDDAAEYVRARAAAVAPRETKD